MQIWTFNNDRHIEFLLTVSGGTCVWTFFSQPPQRTNCEVKNSQTKKKVSHYDNLIKVILTFKLCYKILNTLLYGYRKFNKCMQLWEFSKSAGDANWECCISKKKLH